MVNCNHERELEVYGCPGIEKSRRLGLVERRSRTRSLPALASLGALAFPHYTLPHMADSEKLTSFPPISHIQEPGGRGICMSESSDG